MAKTLDAKLARIRAGQDAPRDFILADAKDGDMAFGRAAPGPRPDGSLKTLADHLDQIRAIVASGNVDVLLASVSVLERLHEDGVFQNSPVTPAARANDTTDIWVVRGSRYASDASRPFHTARADDVASVADLALYSMTFVNQVDADLRTLEAFRTFRETSQTRYFLEVFAPNVETGVAPSQLGAFLNDHIVRCLAGVPRAKRPLFLKIPYLGPQAMEELAGYDRELPVGILGGSAGTSRDAFQLLHDAQRHGAKIALFGRKINLAESPVRFVEHLRRVADGDLSPMEAVRAYHDALNRDGITPKRSLEEDSQPTSTQTSYGGSG